MNFDLTKYFNFVYSINDLERITWKNSSLEELLKVHVSLIDYYHYDSEAYNIRISAIEKIIFSEIKDKVLKTDPE